MAVEETTLRKANNMGATTFYEISQGESPQEAFLAAKKEAQYMHGHAGYTGTIAEKNNFSIASPKPLSKAKAYALADSLIDNQYSNKWGPAGCIPIEFSSDIPNAYLFFGWASE